jgi:DinB superfamily
MEAKREVWQRGPVENIPALLQPIAHALLQAREELYEMMYNFPESLLWERPGGVASPAFHLQHLTGVLDRLFTYAKERALTGEQLYSLSIEGNKEECMFDLSIMLELFHKQVDLSLSELSKATIETLTDRREIGRQKIPTTLIGLYVHAAEHTMRHIGQLLVTVRILQNSDSRHNLI